MSDQPTPPPVTPPAKTNLPEGQTTPPPATEAKFTQADVDRLVGERAVRAKEAAHKELLESLGVEDIEAAKKTIADAKAKAEADLTEIQKANKALEDANKKAEGYEAQIKVMLAKQKLDHRDSKIREAAQTEKAKYPADTISWAEREAKTELDALMAEDGTIDDKAVKALVQAHKKARPELFLGGGVGSPSNTGGTPPSPDKKRIEEALAKNTVRL